MGNKIVLVDYENVQPESLRAFDYDQSKVLVFVGSTQVRLPFELVEAMQRLGDRGEYVRITGCGPNALDFHIAYYIGRLAVQNPSATFRIVSNDTGFDPLIEHLKAKNISVVRSGAPKAIAAPQPKASAQPQPKSKKAPKSQAKPSPKPASPKTSAEDRARQFMANVCQPKSTKPRNEKTLASAIGSFYQKKLSEQEVAAVVGAMRKFGFIKVAGGKISYAVAEYAP
ncbi:MAG: PIN domain-containing protein [Coriobacteriia bacterium]|nr:PIN domain-containing protein [Coriobacteriia bacterium]